MYSKNVKITSSRTHFILLFLISTFVSFSFIYFNLEKSARENFQQFISTNINEIASGDTLKLASKLNTLSSSENIFQIEGLIGNNYFIRNRSKHNSFLLLFHSQQTYISKNHDGMRIEITYTVDKYILSSIAILILAQIFLLRTIFIYQKQRENNLLEKNNFVLSLSKQVAHDIRSPLSALNMVTSSLQGLESEQKELIKSSIQRINDIANDLLKKGKSSPNKNSDPYANINEVETVLINPLVDSIITEKRLQFNNKTNLNIVASMNQVYGCFIQLNPSDLKRVLSNLINNSAEAIGSKSGAVEVSLDSSSEFAIIKINDNGPGIPPHILEKLGNESISYGKDSTDSGSGLGVLHAKKTIESMQGQFSITSKLGVGTEVTISLPLAEKPIWFLDTLKFKEKSTVLICDDDSSIIALWKKRLSDFSSISAYYFTDLDSLSSFLKENPDLNFTLLIDFEFSGEQKTGLDFIIENQLASKAVLVTSHYEEDKIIQSCLEHDIKQIPKNICALVPIEMASPKEYYDAVVLDDEELQIRSWQFAAIQKGKKILTFSKSDEFLSALSNIDHQSCLFIDSILSESTKGEDIATKVNAMGFANVYMSSGHDPSYFKDMKFLKGIIGKTPYFP